MAIGEIMNGCVWYGVRKCARLCHKKADKGNQYGQWQDTRHAKAFETLKGAKALAIGKERGIAEPSTDARCAKCHITGFGEPASAFAKTYKAEDGVGCESCHGPGRHYLKKSIMESQERSNANGLIIPDKDMCVTCHNEESPSYKPFVLEEYWAKIEHPRPEEKSGEE